MTLPEAFLNDIRSYFSPAEWDAFVEALTRTDASCSIRLNQQKISSVPADLASELSDRLGFRQQVPWCPEGFYLKERPNFTLDPLLHAGAYYVQEASSMFITHALRSLLRMADNALPSPLRVLDLCAAPGGKSTAALSVLPEGTELISNEIDHRRARILAENITKWGNPHVTVTGNAPADFAPMRQAFDLIIADVPCSGEGMFRKDPGAIQDWSPQKVSQCVALQRQILNQIWPCLRPGGWLVYSTCTFNVHENEEQLRYICDELGAEALEIPTEAAWQIHRPLVGSLPAYRFMPHCTEGEGLFMAVVRKSGDPLFLPGQSANAYAPSGKKGSKKSKDALPPSLYVLQQGITPATQKGKDLIPSHAMALGLSAEQADYPRCELDLPTALSYLHRDAITLPSDAPCGYVIVTYQGLPLGFVKNLGNRSNNLYPQEWRIRMNTEERR